MSLRVLVPVLLFVLPRKLKILSALHDFKNCVLLSLLPDTLDMTEGSRPKTARVLFRIALGFGELARAGLQTKICK